MREVLIVLTFAVTALGLASIAVYRPIDFYDGRLVDWLQALGTLVAAGVALGALILWRRPDVARRNSETAQRVMRASQALEAAVLRARHLEYYSATENDDAQKNFILMALKHLQSVVTHEEVTSLQNRIDEAETHLAEIRKIFDAKAAEQLNHFVALCRLVEEQLQSLPTLISPNPLYANTPQHLKWLVMSAPILGLLQYEDTDSELKLPKDEFGLAIKASGDALRTHLAQWL